MTTEESTVEFKPGGYNKWDPSSKPEQLKPQLNPLFGDFQDEPEDEPENGSDEPENQDTPNSFDNPEGGTEDTPEGAEDQPAAEEETEEIDNPAYFIAKQLASEGVVALEDIGADISFGDIYENYKTSLEPRVKEQVLADVQNHLTQAGITDDNIIMLQAIQNGVPLDELYVVNRYKKYSTVDPDEVDSSKKTEVIKEWYVSRNLSEKEIKRNLEAIEVNDEVDTEFEEARAFFGETVKNYEAQQREISLENLRQNQAIQQRNQQILDKAIKMGDIYGEKITSIQSKEIEADIFQKSIAIQGPEGPIPVSPFEEFMYKLNNDLEFQLLQYKIHKYRGKEEQIIKEKVAEETEKDFLNAWKKQQSKSASKSSLKRNETTDSGGTVSRTTSGGFRFEI